MWTQHRGDAAHLVRHSTAGLVVAIGGDGTIAEVAAAIAQSRRPRQVLLPLPAGSGNSTCRNLWGDISLEQILDLVQRPGECRVRSIDLLHLSEPRATVLLGASTGFLAQVLIGARAIDANVTGIDRYYAASAEVLQAMPAHPTRVTVDGVVLWDGPTSSVTVGGGRFRARSFQFLPESELDDGRLDVSTVSFLDAGGVADLMPLILTGRHRTHHDVRYGRGQQVVIERTDGNPLVAEFDGDVWDVAGSRLTIDIVPDALRVLVPKTPPCG